MAQIADFLPKGTVLDHRFGPRAGSCRPAAA